jgi:tetratricopeptide (TPR) repeat protein
MPFLRRRQHKDYYSPRISYQWRDQRLWCRQLDRVNPILHAVLPREEELVLKMNPPVVRIWALSLFFAIGCLSEGCALVRSVRVQETTLHMRTYPVGNADPNPPLFKEKVYPYAMQTDLSSKPSSRAYQAVVIENDYIKVVIIPELGGKVYAAHDKTNGNVDFLYRNHVVKPGLVALRGAWVSGGIEWNFPSYGHSTNTFDPLPHRIVEHDDGSISVLVGTTEWVGRMRWTVATTIFPHSSAFRTRIRLLNDTMQPKRAYFWVNAAVHTYDDTRVTLPTNSVVKGKRENALPWPVIDGKDRSWVKNTAEPGDFFSLQPSSFIAAYHHKRDHGTAHFADKRFCPGKKFWTWGTARAGAMWEDLLTDKDGQYIELQSGRLLSQLDTWIFPPQSKETFDGYWFPLRGIGGVDHVNQRAALTLMEDGKEDGKGLTAGIYSTEYLHGASVEVFAAGSLLDREVINIGPATPYRRKFATRGKGPYRIRLLAADGRQVIAFSTKGHSYPAPQLQPPLAEKQTAEGRLMRAKRFYESWDEAAALREVSEALKLNGRFGAAHRFKGLLHLRAGQDRLAGLHLKRALDRNENDEEARYLRLLAERSGMRWGSTPNSQSKRSNEREVDHFARGIALRSQALYLNAIAANEGGDEKRARTLLRKLLQRQPEHTRAAVFLSALTEKRGGGGSKWLRKILRDDPLHPLALIETAMRTGAAKPLRLLADNPQFYLEAATSYVELGLVQRAVSALRLALRSKRGRQSPPVHYYLGALYSRLGRQPLARQHYFEGSRHGPDGWLPFRQETFAVLARGLKFRPQDWKLHYYLGTLLVAKGREAEGLTELERAARLRPSYSVLYSTLAALAQRRGKWSVAATYLRKAITCRPSDASLYVRLDVAYRKQGKRALRVALHRSLPPALIGDAGLLLRRASLAIDMANYSKALAILKENTFRPWENWTGARELYVEALSKRADRAMKKASYRLAIRDLLAITDYPENLGTGRPAKPDHRRVHYLLGRCYEKLGIRAAAHKYLSRAVDFEGDPGGKIWSDKAQSVLDRISSDSQPASQPLNSTK